MELYRCGGGDIKHEHRFNYNYIPRGNTEYIGMLIFFFLSDISRYCLTDLIQFSYVFVYHFCFQVSYKKAEML